MGSREAREGMGSVESRDWIDSGEEWEGRENADATEERGTLQSREERGNVEAREERVNVEARQERGNVEAREVRAIVDAREGMVSSDTGEGMAESREAGGGAEESRQEGEGTDESVAAMESMEEIIAAMEGRAPWENIRGAEGLGIRERRDLIHEREGGESRDDVKRKEAEQGLIRNAQQCEGTGEKNVDGNSMGQILLARNYICDRSDGLNEPFLCFICLELVYKPVVNACGHMFCFWCIHHAMNIGSESYCPLCRRAYIHFPRICEQLHFLLLKALPEQYRRRCKEVYEEEVSRYRIFSPQFNDGLNFDVTCDNNVDVYPTCAQVCASSAALDCASSAGAEGESVDIGDAHDGPMVKGKYLDTSSSSSSLNPDSEPGDAIRENDDMCIWGTPSSSPFVTESDLLCGACKELLYRPVVLNCGHVFCQSCVWGYPIMCNTCGCLHPGSSPLVCLELHQYLEQNFFFEYETRKNQLAAQAPELEKARNNPSKNLPIDPSIKELKLSQSHARMHVSSSGCDGCGICPIIGRRFTCLDCPSPPGYDLCYYCFKTGKIPIGRFNQQHTSKHQVQECIGSSSPCDDDESGEASDGIETYFGIVGYFA